MAEALPGLLTALGCAGFGAQPPDKALVPGVRQHVALPLTGEFPAIWVFMNMVFSCLLGPGVLAAWTIRRAVWPGTATRAGCVPAGLAAAAFTIVLARARAAHRAVPSPAA